MTTKELISKLQNNEEYFTRTYVPHVEKLNIIESIIEVLTYEKNGLITYDTNELEINSIITFIGLYIDLEIENLFTDYDLLVQEGFINAISDKYTSPIGEDLCRLKDMLENKLFDLKRERNTVEAVINRNLGMIVDSATTTLDGINEKISQADTKSLSKTISQGFKTLMDNIQK